MKTPEELGFEKVEDGGNVYYSHKFGNDIEITLEPYGPGKYLLAVYQGKRLLTLKKLAWIHPNGILLVAGLENPQALAKLFHETYEHLAPEFGYETRKETARGWDEIPDDSPNKRLMIAVCREIIEAFGKGGYTEGVSPPPVKG